MGELGSPPPLREGPNVGCGVSFYYVYRRHANMSLIDALSVSRLLYVIMTPNRIRLCSRPKPIAFRLLLSLTAFRQRNRWIGCIDAAVRRCRIWCLTSFYMWHTTHSRFFDLWHEERNWNCSTKKQMQLLTVTLWLGRIAYLNRRQPVTNGQQINSVDTFYSLKLSACKISRNERDCRCL